MPRVQNSPSHPKGEGTKAPMVPGKRKRKRAEEAGSGVKTPKTQNPSPFPVRGFEFVSTSKERSYVFGRPCSDLLSQALRLSTIGAEEFDGRVRDGIGSWAPRKNHKVSEKRMGEFWFVARLHAGRVLVSEPIFHKSMRT